MKIVGETAVPDGVPFPPAWPHKVLQAAVAMRHAYCKAGRAGGPPAEELERLGNVLMDVVTAELGEVLVPSDASSGYPSDALSDTSGRLTDPFENSPEHIGLSRHVGALKDVPERTRSAMDEIPSHDHLPGPVEIASGRWDGGDS
jgi:hypothetical protein